MSAAKKRAAGSDRAPAPSEAAPPASETAYEASIFFNHRQLVPIVAARPETIDALLSVLGLRDARHGLDAVLIELSAEETT